MNQSPKRRKTGWGREILHALGIIFRVLMTALRWVLNVLITILLIGAITGIIVGSAFAIYVKNFIDTEVDETKFALTQTNQTTKLYYMDYEDRLNRVGTPVELVDQRLYGETNNLIASFNELPQSLINAAVYGEDERFWSHKGVDWYRTVGAAANFVLKFSESEFGGSTITQQLIKNVTGEKDYKIQRKVQEIFWALDLEKKMSKEDILTMYLNIIPLSRNCIGVKSAAYTYFGKELKDLTLLESCAIISITNNPSLYDPVSNPRNNTRRRHGILDVMREKGIITQSEYDANFNKELELNLQISTTEPTVYSYYTDMVYEDVLADLMEAGYSKEIATQMLWSGGLEIYTVMDPDVQAVMDEVYLDDANFPENKSGLPAQSGMIVLDPYTSDILGVAGGRGEKTINRGQNYATKAVRPAGSSIKPLSVYAPALEEGLITYASVFDDVPVNFGNYNLDPDKGEIKQPVAWPNNYPAEYRGLTNVNSAVERSVNTVAVRVLQKLTLDKSFDFVMNKLKMTSLIEVKTLENGVRLTDKDVAALALGQLNYGCTVREITAA
ncbi:MAG: transglycosylase domain-containing protein, partial [Clostridia bacterium]|nr:transglycosylase domain-containing protein [Clostridia bacterium]